MHLHHVLHKGNLMRLLYVDNLTYGEKRWQHHDKTDKHKLVVLEVEDGHFYQKDFHIPIRGDETKQRLT